MSLWAKSQHLQEVQDLYGDHFPIEVRCCLAEWLEKNINVDTVNPQHQKSDASLVYSLIQELYSKAESTEEFSTKAKLQDAAVKFQKQYYPNPSVLLRMIRECLETEQVAQDENVSSEHGILNCNHSLLLFDKSINILRELTQQSNKYLERMVGVRGEIPQLETRLQRNKGLFEQKLDVKRVELLHVRNVLAVRHKIALNLIEVLQGQLTDELLRWKEDQQSAGNGTPFRSNLDSIQKWYEGLAEMIWSNRQQVKVAEYPVTRDQANVPALRKITQLLSSFVTSTFVVEDHPPRVLKNHSPFKTVVRSLIGNKCNLLQMVPPKVIVSIISEKQANTLLKNDKVTRGETSGELLNNSGMMSYQESSRLLSVSFRNLLVNQIKQSDDKGTESVVDEKFFLLFESHVSIGCGELTVNNWTLSRPVVVVATDIQERLAWARVTWNNAFTEPGFTPFVVAEEMQWSQAAEALSTTFQMVTGRALSDLNQKHLASTALRNPSLQLPLVDGKTTNDMMLTWTQFFKEPLPECNFTFWEWFFAVMELIREHLHELWIDDAIVGFIGQNLTEEFLKQSSPGTFIIRFSDSELGAVTVAWAGGDEVVSMMHLTSEDLTVRSLVDRIFDLKHLIQLYPAIPKDQAFGKYTLRDDPASKSHPSTPPGFISEQSPKESREPPVDYGAISNIVPRTPSGLSTYLTKKEKRKMEKKIIKVENRIRGVVDVDQEEIREKENSDNFQPNIPYPF